MKYYIGIDLGGTNVRTLLVDENGESYRKLKDLLNVKMVRIMYVIR